MICVALKYGPVDQLEDRYLGKRSKMVEVVSSNLARSIATMIRGVIAINLFDLPKLSLNFNPSSV